MNNMDKLFQLKYLSLKGPSISKVASRIVMLHDLETLDLSGTDIKELPAGVVHLSKLQYLFTRTYCKVPNGIANMRSLLEAPTFRIHMFNHCCFTDPGQYILTG